jgi:hypothetical protein
MRILGQVLLVLGFMTIVYGTARWRTIEEVTSRSTRAFDEYAASRELATGTPSADVDQLRRLRLRLSSAGGPYHGQPDFIVLGALGLILMVMGYYFVQKKPRPVESAV